MKNQEWLDQMKTKYKRGNVAPWETATVAVWAPLADIHEMLDAIDELQARESALAAEVVRLRAIGLVVQ